MAIEESLHFWGKKTDEKCWFYGRMSWVSFAHTTKASFTLWMCFPLTKEARQTDPHSWHLESGKTKLYKIGWIIFCKRMVAFMFTKKMLFQNYHIYIQVCHKLCRGIGRFLECSFIGQKILKLRLFSSKLWLAKTGGKGAHDRL